MKQETIDKLCCPFDKEDLNLEVIKKSVEGDIIEGVFTCSHCSRYYPIVSGVPIMSPDEYREKQLEAPLVNQWKPELNQGESHNFKLEAKQESAHD
jgi:uncharacterized protein YbaR (Trm112 family)